MRHCDRRKNVRLAEAKNLASYLTHTNPENRSYGKKVYIWRVWRGSPLELPLQLQPPQAGRGSIRYLTQTSATILNGK